MSKERLTPVSQGEKTLAGCFGLAMFLFFVSAIERLWNGDFSLAGISGMLCILCLIIVIKMAQAGIFKGIYNSETERKAMGTSLDAKVPVKDIWR
jgi:hypothetical protein